jgi:hypothetical protein
VKSPNRRFLRIGILVGALTLGADAAAWGVHVMWRDAAIERISPAAVQIDALSAQIGEDDSWIASNENIERVAGQPDRYAARVLARARRAAAHRSLVDTYNEQLTTMYSRFYFAPPPAPLPPYRDHIEP